MFCQRKSSGERIITVGRNIPGMIGKHYLINTLFKNSRQNKVLINFIVRRITKIFTYVIFPGV